MTGKDDWLDDIDKSEDFDKGVEEQLNLGMYPKEKHHVSMLDGYHNNIKYPVYLKMSDESYQCIRKDGSYISLSFQRRLIWGDTTVKKDKLPEDQTEGLREFDVYGISFGNVNQRLDQRSHDYYTWCLINNYIVISAEEFYEMSEKLNEYLQEFQKKEYEPLIDKHDEKPESKIVDVNRKLNQRETQADNRLLGTIRGDGF